MVPDMAIVEKLESTLKLSSFGYTPNQKQLDYILEQDVANSFFLGGMIIESHYIENYFSTFLSIVLYNFGLYYCHFLLDQASCSGGAPFSDLDPFI